MEWMLMPLKRYADFSGRSRRMEFWMWQVAKVLFIFVLWVLMIVIFGTAIATLGPTKDPAGLAAVGIGFVVVGLICLIGCLALIIPDIAVAVRRLHDTDRSGWWLLAPVGPYVLAIIVAVAMGASGGATMQGGPAMVVAVIFTFLCFIAALGLAVMLIVFYFLEGTPGPNRYGPDPKGVNAAQTFA